MPPSLASLAGASLFGVWFLLISSRTHSFRQSGDGLPATGRQQALTFGSDLIEAVASGLVFATFSFIAISYVS